MTQFENLFIDPDPFAVRSLAHPKRPRPLLRQVHNVTLLGRIAAPPKIADSNKPKSRRGIRFPG